MIAGARPFLVGLGQRKDHDAGPGDVAPDPFPHGRKLLLRMHGAWPRHRNIGYDASWTGAEQQQAIGQTNGFVDIVRDQ